MITIIAMMPPPHKKAPMMCRVLARLVRDNKPSSPGCPEPLSVKMMMARAMNPPADRLRADG